MNYLYDIGVNVANTTVGQAATYAGYSYLGGIVLTAGGCIALIGTASLLDGKKALSDYLFIGSFPENAPKFTVNFTKQFQILKEKDSLLQPAFNRDNLVQQIEDKLSIKDNSAIFLHGPAGVGKTAIVEQVTYRQITGKSLLLKDYQILKLQQNELYNLEKGFWTKLQEFALTNGTEADLNRLFDAIKNEKYILFIDEADAIINSQFFNKKLEELGRGKVKLIFATTTDQMKVCTENWTPAMSRRIPLVEITEFSFEETIEALQIGRTEYEKCYRVQLDHNAVPTIVALSKNQETKFPHKAVHLLAEICSGIKAGKEDAPLIDAHAVLEYYAKINEKNMVRLREEVQSILVTSNPASLLKNHFHTIEPQLTTIPHGFLKEFEKIQCTLNSKQNVFLLEPSKKIQESCLKHLSKAQKIISINLKELSALFSKLSTSGQKSFLKYYYDFTCSENSKENPIFHIVDGENFFTELATKPIVSSTSSQNTPSIREGADNEITFVNNLLQQNGVPLSIPNVSKIAAQLSKERDSFQIPLFNCPFIAELIKDIRAKRIITIASLLSSPIGSLALEIENRFFSHAFPSFSFNQKTGFLQNLYPSIDPSIILQTLFCALYFEESQTTLDKACAVLERIKKEPMAQPIDLLLQEFIELKRDPLLVEAIASQYLLVNEHFYSVTKCFKGTDELLCSLAHSIVEQLVKGDNEVIFIRSSEQEQEVFIQKLVHQLPEGYEFFHFSSRTLEKFSLEKSFKQKFVYEKLLDLKEMIESRDRQTGFFVLNLSIELQTTEIVALIDFMVKKYQLKILCFQEEELNQNPQKANKSFFQLASSVIHSFQGKASENSSRQPLKLFENSKKIIEIDMQQETRQRQSLLQRIYQTVHSSIILPLISTGKCVVRAFRCFYTPLRISHYLGFFTKQRDLHS